MFVKVFFRNRCFPVFYLLFVSIFGCALADEGDRNQADQTGQAPEPQFVALDVYLNPNSILSAVAEIESNVDVSAFLEYGPDENLGRMTTPVEISAEENTNVYALGLEPDRVYYIKPWMVDTFGRAVSGPVSMVVTEPWPDYYPLPEVVDYTDGSLWDDEEVVCIPQILNDIRMFMCLNRAGQPVWYYITPLENGILNFIPLSENGLFATAAHSIIIFDAGGEVVKKIEFSDLYGKTTYAHWFSHHDIIEITEGPWAGALALITNAEDTVTFEPPEPAIDTSANEYFNYFFTAITEPVSKTIKADGIIVIDWKTEEVLWDWSLHGMLGDNLTIDQQSLPYTRAGLQGYYFGSNNGIDFSHSNSLLHGIDENGQFFWISLRNQDWIIKVDVATEKIVWRLGYKGDFTLVDDIDAEYPQPVSDELWMYHQHSPEWVKQENGRTEFLIFDNGSMRPRPYETPYEGNEYSRAVLFTIDENTMLAEVAYSYGNSVTTAEDHFYSPLNSDVDMLPDGNGLLVTSGNSPTQNNFCLQIAYPGSEKLWQINSNGHNGFGGAIYRAKYFSSIYETAAWYQIDR